MVMSNSLVYKNRSSSADELFDAIDNCKLPYFYMSEVDKYTNVGAVTCTKIIGNRYLIESNVDSRSMVVNLK